MKLERRGQMWTNSLFWINKLELLILKKIKLSIIPKNKWSTGNVIHFFSNSVFVSIFLIQLSFSPFPFSPVFFLLRLSKQTFQMSDGECDFFCFFRCCWARCVCASGRREGTVSRRVNWHEKVERGRGETRRWRISQAISAHWTSRIRQVGG